MSYEPHSMLAFLPSFLLVLIAEIGDKTLLLAMAFAMRYPALKVITGVIIATLLTIGLAVAAGTFLSAVIPMGALMLAASISFILFGLWTVRGESDKEEKEKRPFKAGPVVTVAAAFFLAEMGDKTQLAAISLAVQYADPLAVFLGASAGMVAADAVGIVAGLVLGKRIPEQAVRWVSAIVFIVFGLAGIGRMAAPRLGTLAACGIIAGSALLTAFAAYEIDKRRRSSSSKPTFQEKGQ